MGNFSDTGRARNILLSNDPKITEINLYNKDVGPEGAKYISEALKYNTTITSLYLGRNGNGKGNGIGSEGAKYISESLKYNTTLKKLEISCYLKSNKIDSEGAKYISESLKHNTTLKSIDLGYNAITSEGAKYISESLKHNTTLTSIDLKENKIDSEGANYISESLRHNTTLTSIDLGYNSMTSEGAKYISESLKHNTTLKTINLKSNKFRSEGAKYILESLEYNTIITSLDINGNEIDSEGAKYISESLKHNTTLKSINLSYNNIDSEGAKYISELLKHNTTITLLELNGNKIRAEGAKYISESLKHNTTLKTINLESNKIGLEGAKYILESLEHNTTIKLIGIKWGNKIPDNIIEDISNKLKRTTHNGDTKPSTAVIPTTTPSKSISNSKPFNDYIFNDTIPTTNIKLTDDVILPSTRSTSNTNLVNDDIFDDIIPTTNTKSTDDKFSNTIPTSNINLANDSIFGDTIPSTKSTSDTNLANDDIFGDTIPTTDDKFDNTIPSTKSTSDTNLANDDIFGDTIPTTNTTDSRFDVTKPTTTISTDISTQYGYRIIGIETHFNSPLSPFVLLEKGETPLTLFESVVKGCQEYFDESLFDLLLAYSHEKYEELNENTSTLITRNQLTKDEFSALYLYTCEWNPKEKSIYRLLNSCLTSHERESARKWKYYLYYLFEGLKKIPKWVARQDLYRGVNRDLVSEFPEKYKKGAKLTWYGLTSTTTQLEVVQHFNPKTIFIINGALSGRSLKEVSSYSSEEEILLPPGSRFEIKGIIVGYGSFTLIQLQQIPTLEKLLKLE